MSELILMGNPRRRRKARKARRRNPRRAKVIRRRRRRLSAPKVHRRRRRNPIYRLKHHRRRRRRNPISTSGMIGTLKTGAYGALGGIALDILVAKTAGMLPTALQSGVANYAVKAAGALAIGFVGDKTLGGVAGKDIANGTMAIVLHEIIASLIVGASPTLATSLGLSGFQAINTNNLMLARQLGIARGFNQGVVTSPGISGLQPYDAMTAVTHQRVPGA